MIRTYTVAGIRAAEAAALAALGDGPLMRRAARRVATEVLALLPSPVPGRRAVLLVGPGNNGGDALFAGADLRRRGVAVTAILTAPDRAHCAGLAALRRAGGRIIDGARAGRIADVAVAQLRRADVIVDGLVGIGARPPLRPAMAELIIAANAATAARVAIDVPSGLDSDTGARVGAVFRADVTVTFGGIKTGLVIADECAGRIVDAKIGMDPVRWAPSVGHDATVLTDDDVSALMPRPTSASDKYSGGVVGIVAGSARYPGAALLSVGGAVRARPGLVRYAGPQAAAVLARWPEVIAASDLADTGRVQAWVVGPGLGTDGAPLRRLREVLATDTPVLIDADGLTLVAQSPALLADRRRRGRVTVLTPHAGEFTRLFGDLDPADRVRAVRAAAQRSGAIVLLKGHRTVMADPAGRMFINTTESAYLATAGSGDVLSGVIGSLLAAGGDPLTAVALGALRHGRAGRRAEAAGRAGASALLDLI